MPDPTDGGGAAVDLYWLPLGAGGHFVRLNGRIYEAIAARLEQRHPCALYHSALQIRVAEGTYVIEQAPIPDLSGSDRGVVPRARWVRPGRVAFGSSATRSVSGSEATSRMW